MRLMLCLVLTQIANSASPLPRGPRWQRDTLNNKAFDALIVFLEGEHPPLAAGRDTATPAAKHFKPSNNWASQGTLSRRLGSSNGTRLGFPSRPRSANGHVAEAPRAATSNAPCIAATAASIAFPASEDDSSVAMDLKAAHKHSDKRRIVVEEHNAVLSERADSLEDAKKHVLVSKTEANRLRAEVNRLKDLDQRLR